MKKKTIFFTLIAVNVVFLSIFLYYPLPIVVFFSALLTRNPLPSFSVDVQYNYVSSGSAILETAHYFPFGADLSKQEYPTILIRTPYGIKTRHGVSALMARINAYYLSSMGYHVLLQSTRSRFNSTGEWVPYAFEKVDGKSTLTWLASQKWFNGKLGTSGFSYSGFTQLALLGSDSPIRPLAQIPCVIPSDRFSVEYANQALDLGRILTWNILTKLNSEYKSNDSWYEPYLRFSSMAKNFLYDEKIYEMTLHSPAIDIDKTYLGFEIPQFRNTINHTVGNDVFWKRQNVRDDLVNSLDNSMLLIGGWYDVFINETIWLYNKLNSLEKSPILLILNIHHSSPDLYFPFRHTLPWYEHKLKGKNTTFLPVTISLAPKNEFYYFNAWPPSEAQIKRFYIHSKGNLDENPVGESVKKKYTWTFDPLHPTPYIGGYKLLHGGPVDNFLFLQERLSKFKDIVLFYGPLLSEDMIMTGSPKATLFVSSSLDHSDFVVRLLDFSPINNVSMNICDGFVRISPNNQPTRDQAGVFKVEIEFYPVGYKIEKGHKLVLQVSSGAHPYRSRNTGTGEPIYSATTFLTAYQALFVSHSLNSHISLPVLKPSYDYSI